jgi:cell division protein FtsL
VTARALRQTKPAGRGFRVIQGARRRHIVFTPWVAFSMVVVVALFGIVVARTTLDQGAFELADLNLKIAEAEVSNQRLRLEIARLESPGRVAPAAESLGLVYPTERAVLTVTGIVVQSTDPDPRWATLDRYAAGAEVTP